MSEYDLKALSNALKKGQNQVLEPIFKENYHYCIDNLVQGKGCNPEEAEDLYLESIMNFREKILAGKVTYLTDIKYYLLQTCINMFLVRVEQKKRWERNIPDVERFFYESDYLIDEDEQHHEHELKIARQVWKALGEKCKDIIHYFYVDRLRMNEIAELMGFASAN
ncbi:MAG: hypothetical protein AAFN93_10570, partial [Bacteroidota bacterium]